VWLGSDEVAKIRKIIGDLEGTGYASPQNEFEDE
jgi:hypothetical protein